jgi:hypothetical protein
MSDYKYSMRYTLDSEAKKDGFTKEDAEDKKGLCDSYLFVSILSPPDGSYSEFFMSHDGKTDKELTDRDLFKHFGLLTMRLSQSENLLSWQKFVITATSELLRKIMVGIH